eukprot:m.54216 g.54216  ORF g.54216 m.54216 type:complete len:95 (-) comp48708_c0_seq1:728-1012(-)
MSEEIKHLPPLQHDGQTQLTRGLRKHSVAQLLGYSCSYALAKVIPRGVAEENPARTVENHRCVVVDMIAKRLLHPSSPKSLLGHPKEGCLRARS